MSEPPAAQRKEDTMDVIKITNLKVFAHHGVFPEETRDGQDFYVSARLYLDCKKAGKTDCLEASVDYGKACVFITDFLQQHTYRLIEAATEHLAEAMLLAMPLLKQVEIELCKPHAPIGLPFENVSVTILRGWHQAYLAVGSNMGDRQAHIERGIEALRVTPGVRVQKVSEMIVTKPYGGVAQEDFVNGAVALETLLTPEELLVRLHEIEAQELRERKIHWGPRTLDLDIIFYDKQVIETADLIIPHVDMANRSFVLEPLAQLCPNYRHPLLGKTVSELLAAQERAAAAKETEVLGKEAAAPGKGIQEREQEEARGSKGDFI